MVEGESNKNREQEMSGDDMFICSPTEEDELVVATASRMKNRFAVCCAERWDELE